MRPNILLLHCHDLGRFLGAYGVTTVSTPHLDELAAAATVFDRAFATAPHCSPARASLFTGTYPQQNGVLGLTHEPFGWDLHDPASHIAHRLHDAGYRTELVGVHHESRVLDDEVVASRLGFDRVRTGGARELVVERAVEALRTAAADGRPFYLQVGFHAPHRTASQRDRPGVMGFLGDGIEPDAVHGVTVPGHLVDDAGAREEIAELQGAVSEMDAGVGAVLAALQAVGSADDTIVVFTTDHGLALPRAKCTLYDAGTGVALMMRVPGRPAWSGRRVPSIVSHVDVLPTLFELIGLPVPDAAAGISLVSAVEQARTVRDHAFGQLTFHTYFDPKRSVRSARHKLIANFSNAPQAMDATQSWMHRSLPIGLKGPVVATSSTVELYDLDTDPDETHDLSASVGADAVMAPLAAALLEWMRDVGDPILQPQPGHRRHAAALDALERAATRFITHPITTHATDEGREAREREHA